jgi:hypothetical protein
MVRPPQSRMDILTDGEIENLVGKSKIAGKYNTVIDSQSVYEILTDKLSDAAKKAGEQEAKAERKTTAKKDKGFFDNPVVKSMTRTAGNQIVRSLLGVLGLGGRGRSRKSLF